MKSFIIPLFLCVLSVQIGLGQTSLNDYHYVVVPDQFEFLKGKDQHQVNSLTVWLLNKNGFNAYLDSQLPLNLRKKPCKGLKAVVVTNENFMVLKAWVEFTDCMGTVVYTSDEGRSKDKDYRKSYHEAVRQAFESITALNITQLPIDDIENESEDIVVVKVVEEDSSGGISSGGTPAVAVVEEAKDDSGGISSGGTPALAVAKKAEVTEDAVTETIAAIAVIEADVTESAKSLQFKEYMLMPNQKGFDLTYKGALIGTVKPTSNEAVYLVNTSQFTGVGYPTEDGFIIEREIEGMDQNIKMTFTRK